MIQDSNLIDFAISDTLVSKIKPCMSKYKSFTLKLQVAHYISYSLFDSLQEYQYNLYRDKTINSYSCQTLITVKSLTLMFTHVS